MIDLCSPLCPCGHGSRGLPLGYANRNLRAAPTKTSKPVPISNSEEGAGAGAGAPVVNAYQNSLLGFVQVMEEYVPLNCTVPLPSIPQMALELSAQIEMEDPPNSCDRPPASMVKGTLKTNLAWAPPVTHDKHVAALCLN